MRKIELNTVINEYENLNELSKEDQELLNAAIVASKDAYAPYSEFHVGAALRLSNNEICVGNNQENAAYPSGICAERVAVFSASATHPSTPIVKIAVVAFSKKVKINKPVSPCGACRQVLAEYEKKSGKISILLMGETGNILEVESVADLLPISFTADDLEGK